MSESTFGEVLKQARSLAGLTLRQVEESTGVSNAYLSQLENGKIKKPSANVLYKLAQMYAIQLEVLLGAAGIIPGAGPKVNTLPPPIPGRNLSEAEEQQLLEYLEFLRWKGRKS